MTPEDYTNHWKQLKARYNGSTNYIRALPKDMLVSTRESKIKMKMITLYGYVYKNKHWDILKILNRIHGSDNKKMDDLEYNVTKLTHFVDKNKIYDNIVESKTFKKSVCKLIYMLKKKHGPKHINTRTQTKSHRKKTTQL
jgi:hypothetical protein